MTRMFIADAVVVRIEQHAKRGMKRFEIMFKPLKNKRFKKPAGVREMPFDGAGFGHGLQIAIFGAKWCGEFFGDLADRGKSTQQCMKFVLREASDPLLFNRFHGHFSCGGGE